METSTLVKELVRRLAEIEQEKMKLLTVLHEMRAPLHVMVLYAELILDNGYAVPIFELSQVHALSKKVQGLKPHAAGALGNYLFMDAWLSA